jgi:integrase
VRALAGLPCIQLRDLRPSSATLLLDNHVDAETVAESLGHTTLRMLPTYTPRSLAHQIAAQKVLEDPKTEILDGKKIS